MKKKIAIGLMVAMILFVIADYCELFPIIHIDGAIVVSTTFQFIDSKGDPINNVSITAYLNNYDLGGRFTYYDDNDPSIVFGQVGIGASWKKTILFRKPLFLRRRIYNKTELRFHFKHPDYLEQEQSFLVKEIQRKTHAIVLQTKEHTNE